MTDAYSVALHRASAHHTSPFQGIIGEVINNQKPMTQSKTFELKEENSAVISEFISKVRVINEGLIVGGGSLTILYREKDQYGLDDDDMVSTVSNELGKAQKNYINQEGIVRASAVIIDRAEKLVKEQEQVVAKTEQSLQECGEKIKAYLKKIDKKEETYNHDTLSSMRDDEKSLTEDLARHKNELIHRRNELQEELDKRKFAEIDRDNAKVFIDMARTFIKDIKEGKFTI